MKDLIDRILNRTDGQADGRRRLNAPMGCCPCGTGGPHYTGTAPRVTRYLYADICDPAAEAGDTPDWSSCSAHPVEGITPVVDYGQDVVVTFAQAGADFARALAGRVS